eukprot:GHVU01171230.1.p4 GENE.GHVU01171230.1~~GHVU01171230.1.p4  ORF type:complete len:113 (-),score=18.80 GHVU01171230.1:235-573(-)
MAKKNKQNNENINSTLSLVMKSGKASLGLRSTIKSIRAGRARLVVISSNCPHLRRSEMEYLAMLAKTPVHHYNGDNNDLGTACGKLFRIGSLAVTDLGDMGDKGAAGLGLEL